MAGGVLGYIMARDEWPLVGLAITHALHAGVEHVVAVDHASTDATAAGLAELQRAWPGRLTVLHLRDQAFLQEATTAAVMTAVGAADYAWVYAFDADEFLISGAPLPQLLQEVPESVDAVRYQIQQWIAPEDMNDADPGDYGRLSVRGVPCVFTQPPGELLGDDIRRGHMNYFDVPFPPKVVVRGRHAHALVVGAHSLNLDPPAVEWAISPEDLVCGHLPLLSRERLVRKCRHGQSLIDAGRGPGHGWQSQMLRRVELDGDLDSFWDRHSTPLACGPGSAATPHTEFDPRLREALSRTLELIDPGLWRLTAGGPESVPSALVDIEPLILLIHALKDRANLVSAQRDALVAQRDLLQTQGAELIARCDRLTSEVTELVDQREALLSSRSWRYTAWLRREWPRSPQPGPAPDPQ